MAVPSDVTGKSLTEAEFRQAYKCELLAIQTADGQVECPVDPSRALAAGVYLVVLAG